MDFEIEGDDDDYNFDWGDDSKPAAKKNSMFGGGGGYEEESEYNFSYENDRGTKKKYEAFSPQATQSTAPVNKGGTQKVVVANSGNALERAQNLMDKYSGKTVSAPSSNFRNQQIRTFSEADISLSEDEPSESEFEMSESMDDSPVGKKAGSKVAAKGKPTGKRDINALDSKAHVVVSMGELGDSHSDDSDYLSEHDASAVEPPPRSLQRAPTFDDVDVSQGDEEDEPDADDNEYSNEEFDHDAGESYEESAEEIGESTQMSATVDTESDVSKNNNPYSHANKAPLGVQFAVRNGTSANFPGTVAPTSSATEPTAVNNPTSAATTTATAAAPTGSSYYTTNNTKSVFNSVRNRPPSPAYSDHSDSTRPVSPDPEEESAELADKDHSIRSESPNDNNASYSRLVYGNEDEQDSVSEYSGEESNNNINLNGTTGSRGSHGKPKVFSFADLLSQESWDADKHKEILPTVPATNSTTTAKISTTNANTLANAAVNHLEVSEIQDEFTATAARSSVYVAPTAVSTSAPTINPVISVNPVGLSEPTRSASPPTTNAYAKTTTSSNVTSHSAAAVLPAASHAAPVHPVSQPAAAQHPQYSPYPYPNHLPPPVNPNTHQATPQAPAVDAQGQPLPPPGHYAYPPQYPYPYPPPPVPQQYFPYPYPPSPYYPAPYASPYPMAHPMSGVPGQSPPYMPQHPLHSASHTASYPPSYPHQDVRFSHEGGLYNPLLHGAAPTLHALESLSNPRGSHNVTNRLSLSQSNQLYGSAYFDRDVAQQPLVVDLLQELRKSKEEAQWAKAKLAETIVKLGQQQLNSSTGINSNIVFNANTQKTTTNVDRTESGSAEMKMNTPDKVKKHNAVSFQQDVISPVQPVRASLNNSSQNNSKSVSSGLAGRRDNLDDSELDEVQSESDSDDEDAASDYSDDFEDAASSPAPKGKGHTASATISAGAKPTATAPLITNKTNTSAATAAAIAAANVYTGATLAEVKAAQDEASRGIRERERVLNPLKESLAYSLLASQELFKNQLESLRLRISATNDYTNLLQQRVNTQWDELNSGTTATASEGSATSPAPLSAPAFDTSDLAGTSFQPTPSLHHLRSSFEARRVASSEKLLDLLTQVYPNMTMEEATRLTAKI